MITPSPNVRESHLFWPAVGLFLSALANSGKHDADEGEQPLLPPDLREVFLDFESLQTDVAVRQHFKSGVWKSEHFFF